MHSVYQAQGQGCWQALLGSGSAAIVPRAMIWQKNSFSVQMEDVNPNEDLRKLEEYVMENANKLGIGTMGFGGETTLLGCKIGVMNRIPASFFVSVAYNCWAFRRLGVSVDANTGKIKEWLYQEGEKIDFSEAQAQKENSSLRQSHLSMSLNCKHLLQKSKSAG